MLSWGFSDSERGVVSATILGSSGQWHQSHRVVPSREGGRDSVGVAARETAAVAKPCGVAPRPASSGSTTGRHRLSRSGDRAANSALYIVTIVGMRDHQPTRDYVEHRTAEDLSKREIYANLPRRQRHLVEAA